MRRAERTISYDMTTGQDDTVDYGKVRSGSSSRIRDGRRSFARSGRVFRSFLACATMFVFDLRTTIAQPPDAGGDGSSGSPAGAGGDGEYEKKEGGSQIDWAVILSNPQNLAILFGILMTFFVIIYCLWKKIMDCVYFIWNSFCRVPCCLTCKWCCVPCYKGTRNAVAGCKNAFYEGCYRSCDHYYHPWKKMEYVTSVQSNDTCFDCC